MVVSALIRGGLSVEVSLYCKSLEHANHWSMQKEVVLELMEPEKYINSD